MLGGAFSESGRLSAGRGAFAVFAALALSAFGGLNPAMASPPPYEGGMSFPTIQDASGPEEYSWQVQMSGNQALEQVDDQTAVVYYTGTDQTAFQINAVAAHDAEGASVPTTLAVSGSDVITLTVHHREGNLKAGGASFLYPVMAGQGWEGGFVTVYVSDPPDEAELREQRERREREEREALEAQSTGTARHCIVPRLKGRSLTGSRRQLVRAGCRVGSVVTRSGHAKGAKVVGQSPRPGAVLGPHSAVHLTLGK